MGAIRMRTLRDGKKVYDAEVKRRGHRRLSRTFERLVDARAWVQDVESGLRQGRHMERAEAPRHTLNEAIDRYISEELPKKPKSDRQQHAQLLWFKEQLGYKLLSEITPAVLSECKSAFLKTPTCRGATRS